MKDTTRVLAKVLAEESRLRTQKQHAEKLGIIKGKGDTWKMDQTSEV